MSRSLFRYALIAAALCLGAVAADAAQFSEFKGSREAVKGACPAGQFVETSTGYSCEKPNCNGTGGVCGVYCDNSDNCTGFTPSRVVIKSGQYRVTDLVRLFLNPEPKPTRQNRGTLANPGSLMTGAGATQGPPPAKGGQPGQGGTPPVTPPADPGGGDTPPPDTPPPVIIY